MNESKVKCELKTSGCNMLQSNKNIKRRHFSFISVSIIGKIDFVKDLEPKWVFLSDPTCVAPVAQTDRKAFINAQLTACS